MLTARQPTTKGPITLILLRGPSTNVVPIATIVSGIPNSGHYEWTPSESLEPDTTHYGIKLVVDATGQYQYSTQFGISGSMGKKHTTTATTHHTATQTATATEHHKTTTSCPTSTPHHTKTHTMTTHSPTKHVTLATTTTSAAAVASTGGFNASQASISPQPSSAGAERLGGMVGGAMAGAAAVALFAL